MTLRSFERIGLEWMAELRSGERTGIAEHGMAGDMVERRGTVGAGVDQWAEGVHKDAGVVAQEPADLERGGHAASGEAGCMAATSACVGVSWRSRAAPSRRTRSLPGSSALLSPRTRAAKFATRIGSRSSRTAARARATSAMTATAASMPIRSASCQVSPPPEDAAASSAARSSRAAMFAGAGRAASAARSSARRASSSTRGYYKRCSFPEA